MRIWVPLAVLAVVSGACRSEKKEPAAAQLEPWMPVDEQFSGCEGG